MFDQIELGGEFFEGLKGIDEAIVHAAVQETCAICGGPLHRGDYPRKLEAIEAKRRVSIVAHRPPRLRPSVRFGRDGRDRDAARTDDRFQIWHQVIGEAVYLVHVSSDPPVPMDE